MPLIFKTYKKKKTVELVDFDSKQLNLDLNSNFTPFFSLKGSIQLLTAN